MRIVDPSLSGGASPLVVVGVSSVSSSSPKSASNGGFDLSTPKTILSSSSRSDGEGCLARLGSVGRAFVVSVEGMVIVGMEAGSSDKPMVESGGGEEGMSRAGLSDSKEMGARRVEAKLKKSITSLGAECSSLVLDMFGGRFR